MSDPAPLDAADLVRRAQRHAGVESPDGGEPGAVSLGAGAQKLLVDAAYYHPAWKLPSKARLQGPRRLAALPLTPYTDRQNQFDSDLLAAVASLLFDCQALEARVAQLEAEIARASHPTDSCVDDS